MVARPMISEEQWTIIKPRFNQLYRLENRTLQETMSILKQEDFHATERMYKAQIRKWKLHKNNGDKVLLHLLRKHEEFQRAGKVKAYRIRKRPITVYAARRHFERKNLAIDSEILDRTAPSPTPSTLSIVSVEDQCDNASPARCLEDEFLEKDSFTEARIKSLKQGRRFADFIDFEDGDLAHVRDQEPLSLRIFTTDTKFEHVLFNVRDLCTTTAEAIHALHGIELPVYNLKLIYAGMRSVKLHLQRRKFMQALSAYDEVQTVCHQMFAKSDPWLLPTVVHCIFDFLLDPDTNATVVSLLRYTSSLASTISKNHPMTVFIDTVLNGEYGNSVVVGTFFRLCADLLGKEVGNCYHICFCINRIRAFGLDYYGLTDSAQRVLENDMADAGLIHGDRSTLNLCRLFAIAGCLYGKGDHEGALHHVCQILRLLPDTGRDPDQSVRMKKHHNDEILQSQYEDTLDAAFRLKTWLEDVGEIADHINHAQELVAWLQNGAPLPR